MRGAVLTCALALLAGTAAAGTPRSAFILKFDLLSPAGITCAVEAADAQVSTTRDLFGKPVIRILGHPEDASITCTAPGGARYRATANRTAPYTPSQATWGTVVYRGGRDAMMTVVELGDRTEYQFKTFVRVD